MMEGKYVDWPEEIFLLYFSKPSGRTLVQPSSEYRASLPLCAASNYRVAIIVISIVNSVLWVVIQLTRQASNIQSQH